MCPCGQAQVQPYPWVPQHAPLSSTGSHSCWPSCGPKMVSTSSTGAPATSTVSSSRWPSVTRWAWGGGPGPGLGALPAWTPAHRPHPCHPPQAPGGQQLHLRKFPIELRAGSFELEGWDRSFPSVRELRTALQGCSLRAGDDCFSLRRCCLPRPGGMVRGAVGGGGGRLHPVPAHSDVTSTPRALQPHHHAWVSGQPWATQPQPAQLPPRLPG